MTYKNDICLQLNEVFPMETILSVSYLFQGHEVQSAYRMLETGYVYVINHAHSVNKNNLWKTKIKRYGRHKQITTKLIKNFI